MRKESLTRDDDEPSRFECPCGSDREENLLHPGKGIDEKNAIFKSWNEQKPIVDEIPAATFGSSEKWACRVECLPLGTSGKVLALLSLTDHQLPLKLFT